MSRKTVLITNLSLLACLCIFHVLTWRHLEITDPKLFSTYRIVSFTLFAFLLVTVAFFAPHDYSGQFARTLVIFGTLCVGLMCLALVIFFPFPKAKKDVKVLYIDKQHLERKIIEQVTFAGVFGSDRHDTIVITQLLKNVRWTDKIQGSKIDMNQ